MRFTSAAKAIRKFGLMNALKLLCSRRKIQRFLPSCSSQLKIPGYHFPIYFRHGTTDKYVIEEVLLHEQYACLSHLEGIRRIVDAGANIGTATVYFLERFPEANVVAIEPDCGNSRMLELNTFGYGDRCCRLQKAVWHDSTSLKIERGNFRDGGEWSIQVKPSTNRDEECVSAISIPQLMSLNNWDQIDLLKIDIEGAERFLFNDDASTWLGCIRAIAIELHSRECRDTFLNAISQFRGTIEQHGEVTFWKRVGSVTPTIRISCEGNA